MSNFGSFSYFQIYLSLGVKQGLQKLQKIDINDLRLLFHCNILIPKKCPRKTPFKAQCGGGGGEHLPTTLLRASPEFQTFLRPCIRLDTNLIFRSAIFVLPYDQLGSQFQSSSQFQQMWINKFVIVFTTPIIIKVIEPSLNGFHDKFPFVFITFGFIKYFLTSF